MKSHIFVNIMMHLCGNKQIRKFEELSLFIFRIKQSLLQLFYSEGEGRTIFRNVGSYPKTQKHSRRPHTSTAPLREPEVSQTWAHSVCSSDNCWPNRMNFGKKLYENNISRDSRSLYSLRSCRQYYQLERGAKLSHAY
jgi:hypothetical protein